MSKFNEVFSKEDAWNLALKSSNLHSFKEVCGIVYDACQKAFEEEQESACVEIKRMGDMVIALTNELAKCGNELKIANGIIESRNQEVEELRGWVEQLRSHIKESMRHEYGSCHALCEKVLKATEQPSFPPSGAPDPGEGYRLLNPEKDEKREGDEASTPNSPNHWTTTDLDNPFDPHCWYRRKIEAAMVEPAKQTEVLKCRCGRTPSKSWNGLVGDGAMRTFYCHCGLSVGNFKTFNEAVSAWNALQSKDVPACEPDPLEALLPKVKKIRDRAAELVTDNSGWESLLILIERELARTRKEQKV